MSVSSSELPVSGQDEWTITVEAGINGFYEFDTETNEALFVPPSEIEQADYAPVAASGGEKRQYGTGHKYDVGADYVRNPTTSDS